MRIVVVAAVVERAGRFLVTLRPRGTHLEGHWEFPGGKCEPGETHDAALVREMQEELGVVSEVGDLVFAVTHEYPGRIVELHFYACRVVGEPTPMYGQQMRWVTRPELAGLPFPEADAGLIARLIASA